LTGDSFRGRDCDHTFLGEDYQLRESGSATFSVGGITGHGGEVRASFSGDSKNPLEGNQLDKKTDACMKVVQVGRSKIHLRNSICFFRKVAGLNNEKKTLEAVVALGKRIYERQRKTIGNDSRWKMK